MKIHKSIYVTPAAFLQNIIIAYIAYFLCRVTFILENWAIFAEGWEFNSFWDLFRGSFVFDTSAILYTNSLYAVLMLFPIHFKETKIWQMITKWLYLITNGICIICNLADSVYFRGTGRRATSSIFREFENENNIGSIIGGELLSHWYLVIVAGILIWALWQFYVNPDTDTLDMRGEDLKRFRHYLLRYYSVHFLFFIIFIPIAICGMRGGATTAVRPITISNANQYVNKPVEAAMVLNTPFSLIRTINKKGFKEPKYFSKEELESIYSPIHENKSMKRNKNVVILIVESFGREYIGALNKHLDNGEYEGYTPFIDSLLQHSLTFDYTFCNGRRSIDGMPSVLSSIPMFVEPFFLTPCSLDDVSSIAGELGKVGYYSAFFHGAENGSMGFQAFARTVGFKDYFGRTEFNKDERFDGDKDFDGTWAIWDEPFLQFYALKMSEFKEPFVTSVFTASSHHPYVIPEQYKDLYTDGVLKIHKCIRYTDHALQKFFSTAKQQPWYNNTIFVITSDHTNLTDHEEYQTEMGYCCSPIIIFDPSGDIHPGQRHAIAQQIDIMPTILNYLGYDKPYVAFGQDLFNTPDQDTWAVNYIHDNYQYVKGDYVIIYGNDKLLGLYNYKKDWMLRDNLREKNDGLEDEMVRELRAIIQSYMYRMNHNELIVWPKK